MFDRLRKILTRSRGNKPTGGSAMQLERVRRGPDAGPALPDGPMTVRRWESAQTNRLNQAHWQHAHQVNLNTINADLWFDLPTLRTRCTYEAQNNPFVEGVIETHMTDIVGPDGPTLQVQTSSQAYNEALEAQWAEWFACPDINGVLSGVEFLRLWVRMLWICGEYLSQLVTDRSADGPISLRLLNLHPARLMSPPSSAADPLVVMGIRRTREGKPQQYYIAEPLPFGAYTFAFDQFNPLPPDFIIHQFKMLEPGQARGVPWLAGSLEPIAQLRDYDTEVLDACRAAADQAVVLYTEHQDAPFFNANESAPIERRTQSTAPPGWKPFQLKPEQPTVNYVEYRKERHRELGRPVNMPLMTVRLGSEDHNYSSARFDGQVYQRSLEVTQAWIGRNSLNRLVMEIAREAELARALPQRPKDFRASQLQWTWPVPPHVDPEKEMTGYQLALEIGAMDLSQVAARLGMTLEALIKNRVRTMEALKKAKLPPSPFWEPKSAAAGAGDGKKKAPAAAADTAAAADAETEAANA